MEGTEIKQKYDPKTRKWYCWFVCPRSVTIMCEECGTLIKGNQRVFLNFDNGKRYCDIHRDLAYTDFVQQT